MGKKDRSMEKVAKWLSLAGLAAVVGSCCAVDIRREMDYKEVIYSYQNLIERKDVDASWETIERLVGDPREEYLRNKPKYELFWESRDRRK